MSKINVTAVPDGDEHTQACSCCGRAIYQGGGDLRSGNLGLADYWYRWSEGHQGRFHLAIHVRGQGGEPIENGGVVVIAGRIDSENIVYFVAEPADSPWQDFGAYGSVISREKALEQAESNGLFDIVDAVAANETRLSSRILQNSWSE